MINDSIKKREKLVLDYLINQFEDAQAQEELSAWNKYGFDWNSRTYQTILTIAPKLVSLAQRIQTTVPKILNSPKHLLSEIQAGSELIELQQHKLLTIWYKKYYQLPIRPLY